MTQKIDVVSKLRSLPWVIKFGIGLAVLAFMYFLAFFELSKDVLVKYPKQLLFAIFGLGAAAVFMLIQSSDGIIAAVGASLGSVLITIVFAFLYYKSGSCQSRHGLKILDWVFIGTSLSLMGCFHLLGFDPAYWILAIVLPLIVIRILINWLLHGRKKNGQN